MMTAKLLSRIFMLSVVLLLIGLVPATPVHAEESYPRPVPPELVKRLEEPAKLSMQGDTLIYDGNILDGSVAEAERLLKAAKHNSIRSMLIKSPGGLGPAGIRLGELVRDWRLAVTVDGYCMSACANYVAIPARELFVPDGASLAYHGGEAKTWGDDGKFLEAHESLLRKLGHTDKTLPKQLQREKEWYARQQALFDSAGASSAILDDTQRHNIAPAAFWMFTRDVLERCYSVKNLKQYPALNYEEIIQGKTKIKIIRDCPRRAG